MSISWLLLTIEKYGIDTIVFASLAVPLVFFLFFSIWAIIDISKLKSLSREEKSSLTYVVARWPVYGVIHYVFKVRPTLKD